MYIIINLCFVSPKKASDIVSFSAILMYGLDV